MNLKTEENIEEISSIINSALAYNGVQMCENSKTFLNALRGKLIFLSDGEVDFYFERVNSNARVGMYKITLKCTEDTEKYIEEYMEMNNEEV